MTPPRVENGVVTTARSSNSVRVQADLQKALTILRENPKEWQGLEYAEAHTRIDL